MIPRVVQFETAAQICRCTPAKAKYGTETDSEQVVRTKDEKHFEKRVKQPLTSLGGKGRRTAGVFDTLCVSRTTRQLRLNASSGSWRVALGLPVLLSRLRGSVPSTV